MRPDSMQERLRLANNSDKHKAIDGWALKKDGSRRIRFDKQSGTHRPGFWAQKGSFHGPFPKKRLELSKVH